MEKPGRHVIEVEGQRIDLRQPLLAAFLAWLWPGAGHLYQGRYGKGGLFMVSILTIYVLAFVIGGRHVVYASWAPNDRRWHYLCQIGVGIPAMPALLQTRHLRRFEDRGRTRADYQPLWGGLMAPPRRPVWSSRPLGPEGRNDDLSIWNEQTGTGFELGSWYAVIAGLLNVLVIYDALSGPIAIPISGRTEKPKSPATGSGTPVTA
jgi:hypothetical protein